VKSCAEVVPFASVALVFVGSDAKLAIAREFGRTRAETRSSGRTEIHGKRPTPERPPRRPSVLRDSARAITTGRGALCAKRVTRGERVRARATWCTLNSRSRELLSPLKRSNGFWCTEFLSVTLRGL
jgi:hypothetical protein